MKKIAEADVRDLIREELASKLLERLDPEVQNRLAGVLTSDSNIMTRMEKAFDAVKAAFEAAAWKVAYDLQEPEHAYVAVGIIRNSLAEDIDAFAKEYVKEKQAEFKQLAATSVADKRKRDRRSAKTGSDRRAMPPADDRRKPNSDPRAVTADWKD